MPGFRDMNPSLQQMTPGGLEFGGAGGVPPVPGTGPQNPTAAGGIGAMSQLGPKDNKNPAEALQKVDQALDLAHQLVLQSLPSVTTWNHKLAASLHTIAKSLIQAKTQLMQETQQFAPPPQMGMDSPGQPANLPFSSGMSAPGMQG